MTSSPVSRREYVLVLLFFGALTAALLYPLSVHPASLGRVDNNDGQFSIWNVAWVARTLIVDPLGVLDANIFHPHRWTLAYSEMNLGAGILALPIYWTTGNPYAAHNFVLLLSFVMSGVGTYFLARYLSGNRQAALVAGICFSFAPYLFAHLPHIQLLMTAFIPVGLLAFHRLADAPTAGRGVTLGLALTVQALLCAYYVVFLTLILGFAVLVVAATRNYWFSRPYWMAILVAIGVSGVLIGPLFIPYMTLQQETGFVRPLEASELYSANLSAYFASSSAAHSWMLPYAERSFGRWTEVLFPGFVALVFGAVGAWAGWRAGGRLRETVVLYAGLAALALWASFGPQAGLYTWLYHSIPVFGFMRAPSRFGLAVLLALSMLASIGVARLLASRPRTSAVGVLVILVAMAESYVPLHGGFFRPVPRLSGVYGILAALPEGAVLELPVFPNHLRHGRTQYMLASTRHWKSLVNGYSDFIPADVQEALPILEEFPSPEALQLAVARDIRYAVFHIDRFGEKRDALMGRLIRFAPYMRQVYSDKRTLLYEITGAPAPAAAAAPPQS